jgi:hypothetical protein
MATSASVIAQNLGLLELEVRQEKSEKPLDGALVNISPLGKSFVTDKKGKLTVALPFGLYVFEVEVSGLPQYTNSFAINADTTVTFYLSGEVMLLDDVEITANKMDARIHQEQISVEKISSEKVRQLPVIGGERDFLKAAAYFPGIQTGSEGSADIMVRGGSVDQNLYLLDNAVLYHTNHLYGFLSSFNPQYIAEVDIIKGGFPARFGGKLSSVVNAKTVEPTYDYTEGEVSIGLAASSLYLNKPLIDNKLNLMVAGRRSYYDIFLPLFVGRDNYEAYNFYDLNAKLSWQVNEHNDLHFSVYRDRDLYKEISSARETEMYDTLSRKWSNELYNLSWKANHQRFSSTFNAYYSEFNTSIQEVRRNPEEFYDDRFAAYIKDYTLKYAFEKTLSPAWRLYGGTELNWLNILGAETSFEDSYHPGIITTRQSLPNSRLHNRSLFMGFRWEKGKWLADAGMRYTQVSSDSMKLSFAEPRVNLRYRSGKNQSIKLSYARMSQPLHLLTNPGLGMPVDLYVAPDQQFTPSISDQLSLGFNAYYQLLNTDLNLNIEAYYKKMYDIIAYRDGYSSHIFTNPALSRVHALNEVLTQGEGRSYGLEYFLSKTSGKWQGGLSYTLSWTQHHFEDLNEGRYFPARQDRRHNLAINVNRKLNDYWSLHSGWQYMSGAPVTIPRNIYMTPGFRFYEGSMGWGAYNTPLYDQRERNSYRMKDFHSLSLSFQRKISWKKFQGTLDLGLYNLYNRRNPYFYFVEDSFPNFDEVVSGNEEEFRHRRVLKSVSIFPIIPSVSLNFKF